MTCPLSDCVIPAGGWTRSRVASLYKPICTDCHARPGVYFDGDEWRMKAHEVAS